MFLVNLEDKINGKKKGEVGGESHMESEVYSALGYTSLCNMP